MPTPYEAPLAMMRLALDQARTGDTDGALETDAVLEAAARFARDVLSPLNSAGDATSSQLTAARGVVTPEGFGEAYRRFCADGWTALSVPQELGGQGLSVLLGAAVTEIWGGANLAFAMCPESAAGAIEALRLHAPAAIRERYIPPLVSGRWAAAMDLTEPQSGSDLSTLRTMARPDGQSWLLTGRKIFISWGDHDLAENIVHLVLARTPGAPPGLKGISLFVVPKRLPGERGLAPNDIQALSLEHKMGIRASPTCVMALGEGGGARGWLVGPQHGGMACLFTMMNQMRLGVGLHSTGVAERAWQLARAYAQERLQGRDSAGAQRPIVEHADVRRMLLTMKTLTHAARCLAYTAAAALDIQAERRAALLTPLVKAWCSDVAVEVASLGVQVHGGMGYMDDSEISQVYRDARIGPIFEGTNFIQAQDLLGRKVIRDDGAALEQLLGEMEHAAHRLRDHRGSRSAVELATLAASLLSEVSLLRRAARRLIHSHGAQPDLASAVAYPFLQWLAVVAGGWQWALTALQALEHEPADDSAGALVLGARFYATHILPRARAHAAAVEGGADVVASARPAQL
ncbi:MAG TPA: acyl-CoA dehydrogenase [Steroidobacteraceae bacterium]|nr:acyl-CoA dehydrogenase [Steroidobacteraceae bacterium]